MKSIKQRIIDIWEGVSMKSVKQKLIDGEITFSDAFTDYYNELTQEDFDYIIEKKPWFGPIFLDQHPLLTQKHIDFIIEKCPWYTVTYLSHMLSEENIAYIAENHPDLLKNLLERRSSEKH